MLSIQGRQTRIIMSCSVINNIPDIENYTYLELGIDQNKNFDSIKCNIKMSVDINGRALITATTDNFFKELDPDAKFDIIFIDANHDYDYVLKDFNNSVDHCEKWILVHDMIPPTKFWSQSKYCSDSYKLLAYLIKETDIELYPLDYNFGLTLIKMPAHKIYPDSTYANMSFEDFEKFVKTIKLYSEEEIIEILRNNK